MEQVNQFCLFVHSQQKSDLIDILKCQCNSRRRKSINHFASSVNNTLNPQASIKTAATAAGAFGGGNGAAGPSPLVQVSPCPSPPRQSRNGNTVKGGHPMGNSRRVSFSQNGLNQTMTSISPKTTKATVLAISQPFPEDSNHV